jgi:hypothetical protein
LVSLIRFHRAKARFDVAKYLSMPAFDLHHANDDDNQG